MARNRLPALLMAGLIITALAGPAGAESPCDKLSFPISQQCVEDSKACQKKGGILTEWDVKTREGACQCWDKKEIKPSSDWCILGGLRVNFLIADTVTPAILAKRVYEHLQKAGKSPASVLILRAETTTLYRMTGGLNIYLGVRMRGEAQPSTYYCAATEGDSSVVFGECQGQDYLHAAEKLYETGEAALDLKGLNIPKKK
jgi:hypothetical protein